MTELTVLIVFDSSCKHMLDRNVFELDDAAVASIGDVARGHLLMLDKQMCERPTVNLLAYSGQATIADDESALVKMTVSMLGRDDIGDILLFGNQSIIDRLKEKSIQYKLAVMTPIVIAESYDASIVDGMKYLTSYVNEQYAITLFKPSLDKMSDGTLQNAVDAWISGFESEDGADEPVSPEMSDFLQHMADSRDRREMFASITDHEYDDVVECGDMRGDENLYATQDDIIAIYKVMERTAKQVAACIDLMSKNRNLMNQYKTKMVDELRHVNRLSLDTESYVKTEIANNKASIQGIRNQIGLLIGGRIAGKIVVAVLLAISLIMNIINFIY